MNILKLNTEKTNVKIRNKSIRIGYNFMIFYLNQIINLYARIDVLIIFIIYQSVTHH